MSAPTSVTSLTALQRDLLSAAFGVDEVAVAAWRRWRDVVNWDAHLDPDAFRLLPRTFHNLHRLGEVDPLLPRLKGIARQAWYANQRRLRSFHPTAAALGTAGVELLFLPPTTLLLRDAAAVLDQHAPIVCAVRGAQAEAAIRCLWREGWRTSVRLPRWSVAGYVRAGRGLRWRDPDGHALDLLWQWSLSDRDGRFPGEVWARAGHGRLAGVSVLTMDAVDAVHDLCAQPLAGNAFARAGDLLLLVSAAPVPIDWRRVIAGAAQTPIAPGWLESLAELGALLPHMLPAAVADWPTPEGSPVASAQTGSTRERLATQWAAYRHLLGEPCSLRHAMRQLPGYLLARWNLPAVERIPPRLLRGIRGEWREAHRQG